jgi:hypothetical protein
MHVMTNLGEVSNKVDSLSRNCWDKNVRVEDITFQHMGMVAIGPDAFLVRPLAQRSFCYRLQIPYNYLNRCPPEQRDQLNYWLEYEKNEELFFRFDANELRAVFTPRYKPADNFEILERLDSLGYRPNTSVQCHLDGEFMLLNIPDGEKSFHLNGDRMTPGISISNSEVGLASLS